MGEKLGQNFLINDQVAYRTLDAADLHSGDVVLEIGPGKGVLTSKLLAKDVYVVAVEKDEVLYQKLKNKYSDNSNFEIFHEDIREFDFNHPKLARGNYKIVANIPYYLTSFLIRLLIALDFTPKKIILMIQKEVGYRMVAGAGEMNLLALSVQIFADVEVLFEVSRVDFSPPPKVDSVVVCISPKDNPAIPKSIEAEFFTIAKAVFTEKRKKMVNPLSNLLKISKNDICEYLTKIGINPSARPQDLSVTQWVELYNLIYRTK